MKANKYIEKFSRNWFNDDDDLDDIGTGYIKYPDAIKAMEEFSNIKMQELFLEIEHGDADHRKWLKDKIDEFCKREDLPRKEKLNIWGNPIDTGIDFTRNAGPRDL